MAIGVVLRLLVGYAGADISLAGTLLIGVLTGPLIGTIMGAMIGVIPTLNSEWPAIPMGPFMGLSGARSAKGVQPENLCGIFHHFNTRNSIAATVRTDPVKARQIVLKLSNILRRLLHTGDDLVPLRDELAFIDAYLDDQAFWRVHRDVSTVDGRR
ncbi:MAG: histidine kinase [Candidatus Latescibacteria bacterium]|nr:histidine kinase [Candidatus Latescibacterota bacterium]